MAEVRWGVLGASGFARRDMAPAIHMARGNRLAALATRSPEKAEPFRSITEDLRIHGDYNALLADDAIDAVYVPLPHTLHIEWAAKALEAGKHVLVEKPVAMRAEEIDPLIALRDRTGLICAEAYMIVHHPQWHFVRELLDGRTVGRLRHVEAVFTYDNSSDPGNIRNSAETGGGALPDIGVYTYGSTRWATRSDPEEITHADIEWEAGCDTLARVSARFPAFTAHWVNSMRMLPDQWICFHGTEGLVRLTAPYNPSRFGPAHVDWRGTDGVRHARTWPGVDQYVLQVEAFSAAIRGEAPFTWTLEDALGTQRVIDMAYAAAGGRPAI
ncbi:Gfo/Idh/MocA family protein [Jannaschia aquimarina]|uniref:Gfo protein n=1 Tax=Jannaschia aquimarina TaxID=935700 RepID=A0A0D1EA59_9RHOB|nr:Gfo/Idh/MocA family oxidoreductase [Jannaschia aquimarina]KIT14569.1 Glucose--fructose oxidoreductase precursor [Jannaschia aquimarina]SNT35072.1 Predicted dehydrogenase [Jannaschia aquimarina]